MSIKSFSTFLNKKRPIQPIIIVSKILIIKNVVGMPPQPKNKYLNVSAIGAIGFSISKVCNLPCIWDAG